MLAQARPGLLQPLARRPTECSIPFEIVEASAEALPSPNESFDAVVSILVLCSVADQRRALPEVARVLRPERKLIFLEHIRGDGWLGPGRNGAWQAAG